MTTARYKARFIPSLDQVDAGEWDALANPPGLAAEEAEGERYNPFISSAFLLALERSKSVGARTGWTPLYTLLDDPEGRLVAAAPSYVKMHSMGEYVFDFGWAQAYENAGGRYYPKIQVAVPFTPATGRRLLVARHAPEGARESLIAALRALRQAAEASSLHVTFGTKAETRALEAAGFAPRVGEQFHFLNENYRDFDDFLAALSSRKRKTIKRERRDALGDDLSIDLLRGADIKPEHWDRFFAFYMDTGARKWGRPYLTREFFHQIGATMAERVLLVMARRGDEHIAGAINFLGDDAIYGRNWGALEERPFLHFEVCYYQAIEYAIRHGYKRVEAGAQGEHKLARGYRPAPTRSAHDFADARLRTAVDEFLSREKVAIDEAVADYEAGLPFRRDGAAESG
ncbi:GNAT family N-acetyltransferase [Methylosinus sp. Sm6]|uniref:GNAT family N-acetyltransferase n=1 Tax=Methylosinus sp. Sm6 TaxID=2866948 RepID=UPI001C98FC5C|nr:GNAT family N-acetyltransferase [Methylosinus sp. Sm6]MBY6241093.1 GNAT family N-acetyltransferase [Methylosinus sp. Sm6]